MTQDIVKIKLLNTILGVKIYREQYREQMDSIRIKRNVFHGEWNYIIKNQKK
jgi:hypothetical protein